MPITIYSATGCVRCRVVREFLNEDVLPFQDYDALSEGEEEFRSFYQSNRQKIYRGPDGVEFPVYHEGDIIRQGLDNWRALPMEATEPYFLGLLAEVYGLTGQTASTCSWQ